MNRKNFLLKVQTFLKCENSETSNFPSFMTGTPKKNRNFRIEISKTQNFQNQKNYRNSNLELSKFEIVRSTVKFLKIEPHQEN